MKLKYATCFGFYAPGTNPPCVPKRLMEVSFILPLKDDHDLGREATFSSVFVTMEYK